MSYFSGKVNLNQNLLKKNKEKNETLIIQQNEKAKIVLINTDKSITI